MTKTVDGSCLYVQVSSHYAYDWVRATLGRSSKSTFANFCVCSAGKESKQFNFCIGRRHCRLGRTRMCVAAATIVHRCHAQCNERALNQGIICCDYAGSSFPHMATYARMRCNNRLLVLQNRVRSLNAEAALVAANAQREVARSR